MTAISKEKFNQAWSENEPTVALITLAGGILKLTELLANGHFVEAMNGLEIMDRAAMAAVSYHAAMGKGLAKEMANELRERALRESTEGVSAERTEENRSGSVESARE